MTVSVEEPDPVTLVGEKVPVVDAGTPVTVRPTTPLNPPVPVSVMVYVVEALWFTDRDAGEAVIVKSDP